MDCDVGIFEEGGAVKRYTTSIDFYKEFLIKIDAISQDRMKKTGEAFV